MKTQAMTATARKLATLVHRTKGSLPTVIPVPTPTTRNNVLARCIGSPAGTALGFDLLNREAGEILPAVLACFEPFSRGRGRQFRGLADARQFFQ